MRSIEMAFGNQLSDIQELSAAVEELESRPTRNLAEFLNTLLLDETGELQCTPQSLRSTAHLYPKRHPIAADLSDAIVLNHARVPEDAMQFPVGIDRDYA
jgi:hypothetical protein